MARDELDYDADFAYLASKEIEDIDSGKKKKAKRRRKMQ